MALHGASYVHRIRSTLVHFYENFDTEKVLFKMAKVCIICSGDGIYKCPTCFIYYCSSKCCRKHRQSGCEVIEKEPPPETSEKPKETQKSPEEVSAERLQLLKSSDEVKNLLANPHLRDLLVTIDSAENAEQIVQKAMLEPIFVEFADACIKAVEPENAEQNQDHT